MLEAAKSAEVSPLPVDDFRAVSGRGVQGLVGDGPLPHRVLLGNAAMLREGGVKLPGDLENGLLASLADEGQTPLLLAVDGKFAGVLGLADPLREESPRLVRALKERGIPGGAAQR